MFKSSQTTLITSYSTAIRGLSTVASQRTLCVSVSIFTRRSGDPKITATIQPWYLAECRVYSLRSIFSSSVFFCSPAGQTEHRTQPGFGDGFDAGWIRVFSTQTIHWGVFIHTTAILQQHAMLRCWTFPLLSWSMCSFCAASKSKAHNSLSHTDGLPPSRCWEEDLQPNDLIVGQLASTAHKQSQNKEERTDGVRIDGSPTCDLHQRSAIQSFGLAPNRRVAGDEPRNSPPAATRLGLVDAECERTTSTGGWVVMVKQRWTNKEGNTRNNTNSAKKHCISFWNIHISSMSYDNIFWRPCQPQPPNDQPCRRSGPLLSGATAWRVSGPSRRREVTCPADGRGWSKQGWSEIV